MPPYYLILLCGLLLSHGTTAEDQIEFKREWILYEIKGRTQGELRQKLNEAGPLNPDTGKRFDARTDWNLNWDYQYTRRAGIYRLSDYTVRVTAKIHFPKWADIDRGHPFARRLWVVYLNNLKRHEEGHVELAKRAGQTLHTRLSQLGTFKSKIEIEEAIKQKAREIVTIHKALHQDYDRRTNHGKSQGARFP